MMKKTKAIESLINCTLVKIRPPANPRKTYRDREPNMTPRAFSPSTQSQVAEITTLQQAYYKTGDLFSNVHSDQRPLCRFRNLNRFEDFSTTLIQASGALGLNEAIFCN